MTQICMLFAARNVGLLSTSDPGALADHVRSMRIRFKGPFRKSEWAKDVAEDFSTITAAVAAGKAVGVLTNITELEREYTSRGAVCVALPPGNDALVHLIRAAIAAFFGEAGFGQQVAPSRAETAVGWPRRAVDPVDPVGKDAK